MRRICSLLVSLGMLCSATLLQAQTVTSGHRQVDDLLAGDRVVRATVKNVDSAWERDETGISHIYTTYALSIGETFSGPAETSCRARLRGGTVGEITERITHGQQLGLGDEAVFVLREHPGDSMLRLQSAFAVRGDKVTIDGAEIDFAGLRRLLHEHRRIGDVLTLSAGDAPTASACSLNQTADAGNKTALIRAAAPQPNGDPAFTYTGLTPAGVEEQRSSPPEVSSVRKSGSSTSLQRQKPEIISPLAITSTIYDAWWSDGVDSDGDGYFRSSRLTWDADVVGSTGSLNVYFKLYYKTASASTWNLLTTSGVFTITGTSTTDTVYVDVTGGGHNLYDWRIEVYRSGYSTYDGVRDPSNDSSLNDYPMETATEDALAAVAVLYDAWWSNGVDSDGDGYVRSARLNWDADVSGSTGSLSVYFKLYYRLPGGAWVLFNTSGNFTITGSSSSDSVGIDITGGAHNLYDWRVEVYRAGLTSYDQARDGATDGDLNDYPMETPSEDSTSAILYDSWWSNVSDVDGDGYARSARLNWDADVGGSGTLTVYFKTYYKLSSSSSWTLLNTSGNFTITGSSSSDSVGMVIDGGSHNLYDWRIEVYQAGRTVLDDALDPSSDGDLNDFPMELASEDATSSVPVISNVVPASASAGTQTSVTISGSGFGSTQGSGKVEFFYRDGEPKILGSVMSWSSNQIVAQVPTGVVNFYLASAGSGPLTVSTSQGTSNAFPFLVPFGFEGSRWPGTNPVISYRLDATFSEAQRNAIRRAFEAWSVNVGVLFSYAGFTQTGRDISNDGETEVLYGPASTYCGSDNPAIIGCANCFIRGGASLTDCDLVLNSNFSWSTATPTPSTNPATFDVETIVLHEVGHWLALDDLYGGPDSAKVMYGINNGGPSWMKRTPLADDVAGGTWIYGAPVPMATITSATVSPATINANEAFTIQYNMNVAAAARYVLGASLRPAGTTQWTINDPLRDITVDLPTGAVSRGRSFALPAGTAAGDYDLMVALWIDRNGNGSIESGDVVVHTRTVPNAVHVVSCTYAFVPSSSTVSFAAGSGSVTVQAAFTSCSYTAQSDAIWLTITSGGSRTGGGTLNYSYSANPSTSPRTGHISIGATAFTVQQQGVPVCTSFSLSPSSGSASADPGSTSVSIVGSPAGCQGGSWTAQGNGSWLSVAPGSGSGPAAVTVSWLINSGGERTGYASIAGNTFSLYQAGPGVPACATFTIDPLSVSTISSAGSQIVSVIGAPVGCQGGSWTASVDSSWLQVTPSSGSGANTVTVSWSANTGSASRSGSATIAGNRFGVTQRAPGASLFVITPCRVIDTRGAVGPAGGPALADQATRDVALAGVCGIPATAKAVVANITAVSPATSGFLAVFPSGSAWAGTSTMNYRTGKTRANNAILLLSAGGLVSVRNVGSTQNFIIDVTGYFQ